MFARTTRRGIRLFSTSAIKTADYYSVLEVSKQASNDSIRQAFLKLAKAHHPDLKQGDSSKFKEINEAYQVLSDDTMKAKYDSLIGNKFGQQTKQEKEGVFASREDQSVTQSQWEQMLKQFFGDSDARHE